MTHFDKLLFQVNKIDVQDLDDDKVIWSSKLKEENCDPVLSVLLYLGSNEATCYGSKNGEQKFLKAMKYFGFFSLKF